MPNVEHMRAKPGQTYWLVRDKMTGEKAGCYFACNRAARENPPIQMEPNPDYELIVIEFDRVPELRNHLYDKLPEAGWSIAQQIELGIYTGVIEIKSAIEPLDDINTAGALHGDGVTCVDFIFTKPVEE